MFGIQLTIVSISYSFSVSNIQKLVNQIQTNTINSISSVGLLSFQASASTILTGNLFKMTIIFNIL